MDAASRITFASSITVMVPPENSHQHEELADEKTVYF